MGSNFLYCDDCGCDVKRLHEYYYEIKAEIWSTVARPDEILCIKCLETRLERKLLPSDFTKTDINKKKNSVKSILLINRLKGDI